jgi:hypothetical protein
MSFLAPINCLLGLLFGIRYRVMILFPLIAVAIIEAALIGIPHGTWISGLWVSVVLIACIEIGYLIGAGLPVFLPASVLRQSWDHLKGQRHSHRA